MRYSSFSIFLNFLLVLVILVGSIVMYQVGNFDGISIDALKKDYVYKKALKFTDLPKKEQERYISKTQISKKSDNTINFDAINFDESSINSIGELKSAIRELKNKFLIVQNDNLVLFNEKQKLAKLLKKSKDELVEQKNRLTAKNLEQINETEQQHYKNISEITAKLNDLQRENIELSQGNNEKVIKLKNEIKSLNQKIEDIKKENDKNIDLRILNEQNKNKTLKQTVILLQKRVELLQGNIQSLDKHQKQLLKSKDKQIVTLQEQNRKILNDKKALIEKNTKTLLAIEQKNNNRLKEINSKIANLQNANDELKNQSSKQSEKITKQYSEKISSLNSVIANLKSNIKSLNKKLTDTQTNSAKNEEKLKTSLQIAVKDRETLYSRIDGLKTSLANLKQEKIDLQSQFNAKLEKNEKKHNENYKILNEQIFNYETIISKLKTDKSNSAKNEDKKIAEIRDAFNELRDDVKQRESEYKKTIKKLKYELKEREIFYTKKYAEMKPQKPHKLTIVGKVDCQDMPFGKAKATLACEQKVDSFLSKYDATYYFEVVPIVDNGGFSSLKRLKNHTSLMPSKEIKRLTKLANLGLGKYRAAEGGRLIKEKFKDEAKISYAVDSVAIGKKRGFIIRVYR